MTTDLSTTKVLPEVLPTKVEAEAFQTRLVALGERIAKDWYEFGLMLDKADRLAYWHVLGYGSFKPYLGATMRAIGKSERTGYRWLRKALEQSVTPSDDPSDSLTETPQSLTNGSDSQSSAPPPGLALVRSLRRTDPIATINAIPEVAKRRAAIDALWQQVQAMGTHIGYTPWQPELEEPW